MDQESVILSDAQLQDYLTDENRAVQLLGDFVAGRVDIASDADALATFGAIIDKYGIYVNDRGVRLLTRLGFDAGKKFEAYVQGLQNSLTYVRVPSLNADATQIRFDAVTLDVYRKMGLVDATADANNMRPADVSAMVAGVRLPRSRRDEYSELFIDAIISDKDLFDMAPPSILADAYVATKARLRRVAFRRDKDKLMARFATLASRIDYLILNFGNNFDYFYSDPSNIMDIRDGYTRMFDVRRADLAATRDASKKTAEHNDAVAAAIDAGTEKLHRFIAEYDQLWNLGSVDKKDAARIDARYDEIVRLLADATISDDVLTGCAKYRFLDENGKPIPQFIDKDGKPSLDYVPGYRLVENGRLAQVISLARNDVCMQNVGNISHESDTSDDTIDLDASAALDERVPWKLAEIKTIAEPIRQIEKTSGPELTPARVDEIWREIAEQGGEITDADFQAALDAQVNQVAGFAARLGDKVGNDAPVISKVFKPIEDIDKLAATRVERNGATARKQKIGIFKRMAKNFGNALAMSAGLTFVGKATGVAWAGAAVGTTIGIGRMVSQGLKWRREQKAAGKPHGIKEFFTDRRNWAPALTTGLATAAMICMATGNPELAAGFGIGAVTLGTGTASAMAYNDAINAGYSRGQAIAIAVGMAASGVGGAVAGNAMMNGIVNYVNNNTGCTLFKTEVPNPNAAQNAPEPQVRQYADGVIENNERILNMWEDSNTLNARIDGLMDAGLTRDDAVRYLMAFHDATDKNLGNGYFQSIGMDMGALDALRNSINGTDVNITPESLAAFEHFNPHISATNTVGYVPGAEISYDLPANASIGPDGQFVAGNDFYSTYVNHDAPIFATPDVPATVVTEPGTIFTPNELSVPAVAMLGTYEPRVVPEHYFTDMARTRAGALADRMNAHFAGNVTPRPEKPVTPERPISGGDDAPGTDVPPVTPDKPISNDGGDTPPVTPDTDVPPVTPERPISGGDDAPGTDVPPVTPDKPISNDGGDTPPPVEPEKSIWGHGFFHGAKEIIYKTMQATYHGMQKIQQGVHTMLKQSVINQTERELEKEKRVIAAGKRNLAEVKADNKAKFEILRGEIERAQKELEGKLKRDATANDARRMEELKELAARVMRAGEMSANADTLRTAKNLEIELAKLDEKLNENLGRADVARRVGQKIKRAEGRQDVAKINADTAVSIGARFRNAINGLFKPNQNDIEFARIKAEMAEIEAGASKTLLRSAKFKAAKELIEKAGKKPSKAMLARIQRHLEEIAKEC